jgi:hypothetical protein
MAVEREECWWKFDGREIDGCPISTGMLPLWVNK